MNDKSIEIDRYFHMYTEAFIGFNELEMNLFQAGYELVWITETQADVRNRYTQEEDVITL